MNYNSEQLAVIQSLEPNILVRASAGSGKTTVLLGAIAEYRRTHPNARIDAITFTRAAANELASRLQTMGIGNVNVSTIHVWAYRYLCDYAALYRFNLAILSADDIRNILSEIMAQSRRRYFTLDEVYRFVIENVCYPDLSDNKRTILNSYENKYIHYKRENNLYDFTDYPLYLFHILKEYDEYIYKTDALFVDEVQDVDEEQSQIFSRVNCEKKFFIGDEKQMIYGFRGASREIFEKLGASDDFTTYTLYNNYRSFQEIADYAMTFYDTALAATLEERKINISNVTKATTSDIDCLRGLGGEVMVVNPFGEGYLNNEYYSDALKYIQKFMLYRPQILCRTNKEVVQIRNMGYFAASTIHQAKGLEYDNVVVVDHLIKNPDDCNVGYVALSRAKNRLLVCSLPVLLQFVTHSDHLFI